jgi:hypothetical protein
MEISMSPVYFACDWVVRDLPLPPLWLGAILRAAKALECELATGNYVKKSNEGYATCTFIVQAPSTATFEQFAKEANTQMGLVDWYSASEQDFRTAGKFWPGRIVGFVEAVQGYGSFNDDLRRQRDGNWPAS